MIINADCRALLSLMAKSKRVVEATVTSLPIWGRDVAVDSSRIGREATVEEYITNVCGIFSVAMELTVPGGALWLHMSDVRGEDGSLLYVPERVVGGLSLSGWKLSDKVVWDHGKDRSEREGRLPQTWDYLYGFTAPGRRRFFNEMEVWSDGQVTFDGDEEKVTRPVAKSDTWQHREAHSVVTGSGLLPEAIIRKCLLLTTKMGDVVFDPFVATGNTYVVAEQLGRQCIASDIDHNCVRIALERVARVRGHA